MRRIGYLLLILIGALNVSAALAEDRASLKIEFKKGGAACVEFAGAIQPGGATLKWLMPPHALRALKR